MPRHDPEKAQKIREDIRKWDNAWKVNKTNYHMMTEFIMGEQWQEKEARLFEDYKKIPLTVNLCAPQLNHLVGEQRQNTPNLQIEPTDDTTVEVADVRCALLKSISINSHSNVVYQNALEQGSCGGFGAFRFGTEYDDDDSFDQHIVIAGFKDPTKCYWDISAQTESKTDGMCAGYRTVISRKKFRGDWGSDLEKEIGSSTTDVSEEDDIMMSYSDETSITIIDHYERIPNKDTLYQLSNSRKIFKDEFKNLKKVKIDGMKMIMDQGEVVTILTQRDLVRYSVEHSKWAGDYELETVEFPSMQLPIVFVDQHSYYDQKGKQITRSFFKDARDSQRFLNFIRTQSGYLLKIARYDQFMASKQNVKSADTSAMWRDPQTVKGALLYDESPNGNKPEQLMPPELSQSLERQYNLTKMDIQATTGMFDAMMGKEGGERSFDAITALIKRGGYNTYVPMSALDRAIAVGGEIINEMIPKVYDSERIMNLEMKDTGMTKVAINQSDEYGLETKNDMTKGKFKIRLVLGTSIESQKTENLQSMDMVLSKQPDAFHAISDLYVENLPMANSLEMKNRLKATIAPEIIKAGKTGEPIPQKPQQQDPMIAIKQMEIQHKMMQTQLDAQSKAHELQLAEQKLVMESHSKGVDYAAKLQELKMKENENAAALHEKMLSYQAEMARIHADVHLGHSGNIKDILTHQPNHFKAEKEKTNATTRNE